MRSIKLTAAGAAAASLALFCAGAASAAFGHEHHVGLPHTHAHGCRLSLELKQRFITVGEPASTAGTLSCPPGEPGAQPITIYARTASSPTITVAATGTTEKNGSYAIPVANVVHNTELYAVADGVRSIRRVEKVLAEVKLEGPPEGVQPTTLRTGRPNETEFKGTVSPEDEGAVVILQRQNIARGEEWHRIGERGHVGGGGHFVIKHTFHIAGPANIRVLIRDPGHNVATPSNMLFYEIEQKQNPSLEIKTSADPISDGQSVTISGKVGGAGEKIAVGTPVKLLARAAHTMGYSQVAETKTENEAGDYTFASQSPVEGTFYKAEALDKSSAPLYEGVKYVLKTNVTPTTIEAGKTVTFSGTVKPGVEKHRVYLERENGAHTAFHVIETTEEGKPTEPGDESAYSITYRFFALGTTKVRIKVPGDPQNGSTVSETFTIQVNPASASSLVSSPTQNPTLPSEGQI
jgi:hypothetical protein